MSPTAKQQKPKRFSKRFVKPRKKPILNGFDVRYAVGNQTLQAVGVALIANFPKTFSVVVSQIGTPLKPAGNARPALISGVGHRV